MTRTAPLMTLLAVGVLGGALFVANTVGSQESPAASNTAASAPDTPAAAPEAVPDAAPPADPAPAEPGAGAREVDLSGVEVAGASEGGPDAPPADEEPREPPADPADEPADDPADEPAREPADEPENTFAGRSNDGRLTVAIAVNGNDAAAVVTDGETGFALDGTATANGLDLENRTGRVTLDGDNPGDGFTGSITVNGERFRYTADLTGAAGRSDIADAAERVGL